MSDHLRETFDQVVALIPKYTWELMDEEQRDALFIKIVLPRHGKTTHDGKKLGDTAWAGILDCTRLTVQGRVRRLKEKAKPTKNASIAELSESQRGAVRGARSAIKGSAPAVREKAVEELLKDPEVEKALLRGMSKKRGHTGATKSPVEREIDVWDLLLKVGAAQTRAVRHLPDYIATADMKEECEIIARESEVFAEFVRAWAKGTDITDDISEYLASQASE